MFDVEVVGDDELARKLEPSRYGPDFRAFWGETAEEARGAGVAAAPRRSGGLAGGFMTDVDPSPLPGWGKVTNNTAYARPVQGGTVPHMPPAQALVGMAGSLEAAFAIARGIAKRGTKARPFFGRVREVLALSARKNIGSLASAIERRFGG